jgi:outer membrane lipoprotein-sorting protein
MDKALFLISFLLIPIFALTQSATDIIKKAETQLKGKSSWGIYIMTITTPDYTRELKMENWWVGTDKALIVIKTPKKEAGNKTLKIKNEMWNYLKSTETTIKIPPSMMLQSWNGSDFTNDDLARESDMSEDYTAKTIAVEQINGETCWKIELTPKPDVPVVYGKVYYWVREKDYLPAVVEYYDEKGKQIRYMVFSDYKTLGGRKIPAKWSMFNKVKEGNRTDFDIIDIKFDLKINDKIFSFQELERGN